VIIRSIIAILIGFGSGVVVSGGVFAFIAIIGVVPRLAQKTKTHKYIRIYEDSITIGGILGTFLMLTTPNLSYISIFGKIILIIFGFMGGIFVGCIAVSLAEVLDVIPILSRRLNIRIGMKYFMLALAVGKMVGALIYFLVPGFLQFKN